jgi:tRNA-dihydrouridine synthase B
MEPTNIRNPAFRIKNIPVYGDMILAPMDGVSDLPFRVLARQLGSAMSYTEFVNAIDVLQGQPSVARRLAYREMERPVVIQIFDDDPDRMVDASLKLMKYQPDILDINMGCPSRDVAGRGAGAGLLRRPAKVAEMFRKLTKALPIPITAKIRLGWDDTSKNYLEVVRIIEENGGSLVAVHARTKAQGYSGRADWEAIAEIKQAASIPIIGNGDVRSVADYRLLKTLTGCDGVMIGRSAIDNPWILARLDREDVPLEEVRLVMLEHLQHMLDFYGERGLLLFRKFIKGYLRPYSLATDVLKSLLTCENVDVFMGMIHDIFEKIQS